MELVFCWMSKGRQLRTRKSNIQTHVHCALMFNSVIHVITPYRLIVVFCPWTWRMVYPGGRGPLELSQFAGCYLQWSNLCCIFCLLEHWECGRSWQSVPLRWHRHWGDVSCCCSPLQLTVKTFGISAGEKST